MAISQFLKTEVRQKPFIEPAYYYIKEGQTKKQFPTSGNIMVDYITVGYIMTGKILNWENMAEFL